jgi:hypothetical protein
LFVIAAPLAENCQLRNQSRNILELGSLVRCGEVIGQEIQGIREEPIAFRAFRQSIAFGVCHIF